MVNPIGKFIKIWNFLIKKTLVDCKIDAEDLVAALPLLADNMVQYFHCMTEGYSSSASLVNPSSANSILIICDSWGVRALL